MVKESPNTLKAVLRALRKATDTINTDRETAVKIVAREMKTEEGLTRDIMALNVHSMELNDRVIYTKLLEEAEPSLVKWKSRTEVK